MSRTRLPLDYLPAEESFHDPLRTDAHHPDKARCVVIPFGLEASVSYGSGTASGPSAILAASHQLELYDEDGFCFVQFFGERKPRKPELDGWREILRTLPALETTGAAA